MRGAAGGACRAVRGAREPVSSVCSTPPRQLVDRLLQHQDDLHPLSSRRRGPADRYDPTPARPRDGWTP